MTGEGRGRPRSVAGLWPLPYPESCLLGSALQGEPGRVAGAGGLGLPGQKGDAGPSVSCRAWQGWIREDARSGVGTRGGGTFNFVSSLRAPLDPVARQVTQDPVAPQDFLEQW